MQMRNGMQSRRSLQYRSAHRSGVKAPTAFVFPLSAPSFVPHRTRSLGPPPLTPAVRPALRQVSRGERAAAGRDYQPQHPQPMDTKPNFGERVKLLRETAYTLRNAAEIVLTEVQHMEAASQRFQQRTEKRGRNMPAATR